MTVATFEETCRQAWLPPAKVLAEEWIPNHVQTPPGSEYEGYFTFDVAPHTRDVLRAWDDEYVREIYLCWATRCMKTSTMIALMMCAAVNTPRPMAFGSANEPLIDRTIDEQIYPMLDACEETSRLIPSEGKRGKTVIKFDRCRVRKAYGGSPASVSGYPAAYVFGNEWDKWPEKKSTEASAANSLLQRTKGYPFISKAVLESTPSTKEQSRVWASLHADRTDHREWYVPCPVCEKFQRLDFERLKYDVGKGKKPDIVRAAETAVYICEHCEVRIYSDDRPIMQRAGVWLSEGQRIDKRGRIYGEPTVRSPYVGFGPLSSLNSLLVGSWGQLVADFLKCEDDPDKVRDFTNSTLSLPYDPTPVVVEPHELGELLKTDDQLGVCPEWSLFLTITFDVQTKAAGWEFPWMVCGWGLGGRGAVVDYGVADSWDEVDRLAYKVEYPHADGGESLRPAWRAMDSSDGNSQEDVYEFCRKRRRFLPLKGSSHLFLPTYVLSDPDGDRSEKKKKQKLDKRRLLLAGKMFLLLVNTQRSNNWLQRIIEGRCTREDSNWFSIPTEAAEDGDFLEELLNEVEVTEYNQDGYPVKHWKKRDRHLPNDQRDNVRYNWTLGNLVTHHGSDWWNLPTRESTRTTNETTTARKRRRKKEGTFATKGGGRRWQNRKK